MDLGIKDRTALVCGASKGLGRACALALAREGVHLFLNARDAGSLKLTADEITAATGARVTIVAADITTPTGRDAALRACPDPDILVTNAGGPPPGDFREVEREDWLRAIESNMLTPIFLIRATIDGMISRRFGRIVNITTSGVKSPATYPQLGVSIGVRAGLTGFIGTLARQVAKHNVTINGLLPGRFLTERLQQNLNFTAKQSGITLDEEIVRAQKLIPAERFGRPDEFGALCAFVCSEHAGYITGQNLMLDGGAFPGLV